MKKSLKTLFLASLTAFALAGLAMAPVAEAARGGGGGGARAGGGGGASRQVNNSNRDVRANNVRNTSVNNGSGSTSS